MRPAINFRRPETILGLVFILILGYLIVVPLFVLLKTTFVWGPADLRLRGVNVQLGAATLYHWKQMLSGPLAQAAFYRPLLNTLVVTAGTLVIILGISSILAYLVVRTDLRWKKWIANLAIVPYILPSWVLAQAWLQVFKHSNVGMSPGLLEYYLGLQVPDWLVFGPIPIAVTMGLHYYPFGFLLLAGALTTIDSQLEESAEVLGARRGYILRKITLPIVMPAILSTILLGMARAMGTFGTAAILGLPERYYVLSTQIYSLLRTQREGQAFILAFALLLIAAAGLYVNARVTSARRSYTTIGGKGVKRRPTPLGRWNTPIAVAVCIFLLIIAVFPMGLLTWSSLMLNAGDYSLSNLSLHYWIGESDPRFVEGEAGILRNEAIMGGLWNSLKLALTAGLLCGLLGMLIGYVVVKGKRHVFARVLEQVTFIPMLVPSIVFGAIYLSLFAVSRGPIPALYGTFALLVLVTVAKQLPYTARSGISSMHQVSGELEEAAVVLGAPWLRRFRSILFPLTRSGFVAGSLIVLITTMRELSLYILLVTPSNRVLTAMTYRYIEVGYEQFSNAMTVLLTVVVMALTFIIQAWQRTDLAEGLGGK